MVDDLRELLSETDLELLEELGGSSRSQVRRIRADGRTLIVKSFAGDGWARETAALAVLPAEVLAPRIVATRVDPPTVVMTDLGAGGGVADALLGADPAAAAAAVTAWATAIATLHRATAGLRAAFRDELSRRADQAECTVGDDLAEAARVIGRHCAELGVEVPAGALDELRGLAGRLGPDGPAALTPGDACPDNNVVTAGGIALIDFEGAQWRHLAWDIAYLTVPWPSCWCAWRLPSDVAGRAVDTYRAALGLPYAESPAFDVDVADAAAGWAFLSASWFLEKALGDDPALARPGPSRRAMIMHRLRQTRKHGGLGELAGRLHEALARRWGEVELPLYPASRRG